MDIIDLDKQGLEIARKRLLENTSYRELGRIYYAAPSTIHRRLTKWLKQGRFILQDQMAADSQAFLVSRDDELSEALARKTGIWRARVVRISGAEPAFTRQYQAKPESEDAREAFRASDELHRCLGEAAAALIFERLRKNMTIGISSGRGVGYSIEKLGELVRRTPSWGSGYESLRLVSLCGGVHVGQWGSSFIDSRDFDADENVFALSAILRIPRNNINYMTGPISLEQPGIPGKASLKYKLDLAITGLGQLNTQHHYFRDNNELQLRNMAGEVRKIIRWESQYPELCEGIAEIILRLYYVGSSSPPEEFLSTLRTLNKSILAAPPEKVKNASEVMLVAGGSQKLEALYGVLAGNNPETPINKINLTLVTDSWTAQSILNRISRYIPKP